MFKAKNILTGAEIIILDARWLNAIDTLRTLTNQDVLVCQGCNQPLSVRKGVKVRSHFANKTLKNCVYGHESTEILQARAVLYEWLITKYPGQVTIEKVIDNEWFPRPVDCWVDTGKTRFAYWMIDSGMSPEKRNLIQAGFGQIGVHVIWVFLKATLRESVDNKSRFRVQLNTTERSYLCTSRYDEIYQGHRSSPGHSLHYLDADSRNLITVRGLYPVHEPQEYAGRKQENLLSLVRIDRQTGEFVHPGEYEQLQEMLKARHDLEKQRKQVAGRERQQSYRAQPQSVGKTGGFAKKPRANTRAVQSEIFTINGERIVAWRKTVQDNLEQREAVCLSCGSITREWSWFILNEERCICNECVPPNLR